MDHIRDHYRDHYRDQYRDHDTDDPAADGLPEVTDDDSYADDVHEAGRDPGLAVALPPDREDGPLALEDYGTTARERLRGEPLEQRLAREWPEDSAARFRAPERGAAESRAAESRAPERWAPEEPDPQLSEDLDPDAVEQLTEDTRLLAETDAVDPRLGSEVSMYDRPVSGIPYGSAVGRLVRPGGGYPSVDADEFAYDVGWSAGGFGSEELAMHEIPLDQQAFEERESTAEPYVDPALDRPVWTGQLPEMLGRIRLG